MAGKKRAQPEEDVLKHPSTKRAKAIDANPPMLILQDLVSTQPKVSPKAKSTKNVLHWFRSKDLRAEDNRGLAAASAQAQANGSTLLTCFLWSPKDFEWHGTSPARTDFMLESLRLLQTQLQKKLHIPLTIIVSEERGAKGAKVAEFVSQNNVGHVFANYEYEVDELRRDIDMFDRLGKDVRFQLCHDQTIVEPGRLKTGTGGPMKVFTPYHKLWMAEVADDPSLLDLSPLPQANAESVKKDTTTKALFETEVPALPESKQYASKEQKERLRGLWPPGHKAAMDRLQHFVTEKIPTYDTNRTNPAKDNGSRLSPYFASGILSVREACQACAKVDGKPKSKSKSKDKTESTANYNFSESSAPGGVYSWVREIVFREFYRHTLTGSPHDSMNLPHNLKFDFVNWEEDPEGWDKWCKGTTGQPFVDAGMRQLAHEGYMHNRLRMNTASYLRTNLLIDYRRGERFFAENLVDWDLANNTNGWEPSYTVFNGISQAERNDPDGEYIRKWVPELRGVKGKAVFDPYKRLGKKEFEKLGYPKPHIDFSTSKARCMQRYKSDMADAVP